MAKVIARNTEGKALFYGETETSIENISNQELNIFNTQYHTDILSANDTKCLKTIQVENAHLFPKDFENVNIETFSGTIIYEENVQLAPNVDIPDVVDITLTDIDNESFSYIQAIIAQFKITQIDFENNKIKGFPTSKCSILRIPSPCLSNAL
jgi:hypothetical protein